MQKKAVNIKFQTNYINKAVIATNERQNKSHEAHLLIIVKTWMRKDLSREYQVRPQAHHHPQTALEDEHVALLSSFSAISWIKASKKQKQPPRHTITTLIPTELPEAPWLPTLFSSFVLEESFSKPSNTHKLLDKSQNNNLPFLRYCFILCCWILMQGKYYPWFRSLSLSLYYYYYYYFI